MSYITLFASAEQGYLCRCPCGEASVREVRFGKHSREVVFSDSKCSSHIKTQEVWIINCTQHIGDRKMMLLKESLQEGVCMTPRVVGHSGQSFW